MADMAIRCAALQQECPDCDYTMAETLFKMYDRGTLGSFLEGAEERSAPIVTKQYGIVVAQKISDLPSICEATSADSSSLTPP